MSKRKLVIVAAVVVVAVVLLIAAMAGQKDDGVTVPPRSETIPADAVKMTPATDGFAPVLQSTEWQDPVPMPGPVNTAGAEDSPFITPDGERFFFFFTPDVRVPVQEQLLDEVTGIWWCQNVGGSWTEPERILLNDDLSLEGAEFVQDDTLWFASVRAGNYGEIDIYTAEYVDGEWGDVENAGEQLNVDYDIGEFHITADGQTMYFHTGKWSVGGDMDLWTTERTAIGWGQPAEVPGVNTASNEGYPFITEDGSELWYTGDSGLGYTGPALYRCLWDGDAWGPAEEMVSNFAGECTMDDAGNLYFVHHYFAEDMTMIEADIYVAYRNADASTASDSTADILAFQEAGACSEPIAAVREPDGADVSQRALSSTPGRAVL